MAEWGHERRIGEYLHKRLLRLSVGLVEDLRSGGPARANGDEQFSPDFQLCLPHRGLFLWHVEGDDVVGDASQVLFVTGGERYRISNPLLGGYRELILTLERSVLSEIAYQSFRAQFLSWATPSQFRQTSRSRLPPPTP